MLYFRCPTCKTVLANKQLPFEAEMEKICKDRTISDDEKNKQKKELLDKLELKRYCCRTLMMTYIKTIDIVK